MLPFLLLLLCLGGLNMWARSVVQCQRAPPSNRTVTAVTTNLSTTCNHRCLQTPQHRKMRSRHGKRRTHAERPFPHQSHPHPLTNLAAHRHHHPARTARPKPLHGRRQHHRLLDMAAAIGRRPILRHLFARRNGRIAHWALRSGQLRHWLPLANRSPIPNR